MVVPLRQEILENLQKKFLKKSASMHYFSLFYTKLTKYSARISRILTKTPIVGKFVTEIGKFWMYSQSKFGCLTIFGKDVNTNT